MGDTNETSAFTWSEEYIKEASAKALDQYYQQEAAKKSMLPSPMESSNSRLTSRERSAATEQSTAAEAPVEQTLDEEEHPVQQGGVEQQYNANAGLEEQQPPRLADVVDVQVANLIVNLHNQYMRENQHLQQKNTALSNELTSLRADYATLSDKVVGLELRLTSHVALLDGLSKAIIQARSTKQQQQPQLLHRELEIARRIGGEHGEAVEALHDMAIQSSVQPLTSIESDVPETTQLPDDAFSETASNDLTTNDYDELPPVPDVATEPIRSTGLRVTKRKNTVSSPQHTSKRRAVSTPSKRQPQRTEDFQSATASLQPKKRTPLVSTPPRRKALPDVAPSDSDRKGVRGGPHANKRVVPFQDSDLDSDNRQIDSEYESVSGEELTPSAEPSTSGLSEPPTTASPAPSQAAKSTNSKSRYSGPRQTGFRFATGPPGRRFKYTRMPKTVALVYREWKQGLNGNPSIESLENQYGTGWRLGGLKDRKYGSNFVGLRLKIVRAVDQLAEKEAITVEEAIRELDNLICGRMQLLITAIRINGVEEDLKDTIARLKIKAQE